MPFLPPLAPMQSVQWKRKNWFRAHGQKCPGPALSLSSSLTLFVPLKVIELLLSADCIFRFPSCSRAQPSPAAVIKAPRLWLQWPNASKCWFPSHSALFPMEKLIYPAGPDGQIHQLKSPFQRAFPTSPCLVLPHTLPSPHRVKPSECKNTA